MLNAHPRQDSKGGAPSSTDYSYYDRYEDWKGWTSFFQCNAEDAEYFAGELGGIPLAGKAVLEIGFGKGTFLAWAQGLGASIAGTEINAKSLFEAKRFGVALLDADLVTTAAYKDQFDVIVALDVFEHFTIDEIFVRMRAVETMLKPGGHVILRFPNGQSPFGLAHQNGDMTHKTALSKPIVEQICQGTTLTTVHYAGAFRIGGRWGFKRVGRLLRTLTQRLIGAILNAIYAQAIPWDSVVVLVMRKQ